MELVDFLRTRLDEDEAVARAVGYDRIEAVDYLWNTRHLLLQRDCGESKATTEFDAELATHIARHDPARVLAEVEAKRMLLDSIIPTMNAFEDKIDEEWGTGEGEHASAAFLRAWARAYRDHPDFDPDWLEE